MEAVLSPRFKNVACACLVGLLAAGALYCKVILPRTWSTEAIAILLNKNSARLEALLADEIDRNLLRSERLLKRFRAGQLTAGELEKKEALVSEKNGVIDFYYGEIYFFKSLSLTEGDWRLVRKNQDIYFFRRLGGPICYLSYLMDTKSSLLRKAWRYPCSVFDLKYSPEPLTRVGAGLSFDQARNSYYYSHILKAGRSQLVLNLIFSAADFSRYFKKWNSLFFYGFTFLLFIVLFLAFSKRSWLQLLSMGGMTWSAWFFLAWLCKPDIYLSRFAPALQSVWQLLVVLLFSLAAYLLFAGWRLPANNWAAFVLFNLLSGAAFYSISRVLPDVDFPFSEFALRPGYLGLLALLIGLHAIPLLVAVRLQKPSSWRVDWPVALLQSGLVILVGKFFPSAFFSFFLLALLFIVFLLCRRRFWPRILLLVLLALSIGHWLSAYSTLEKQEFISSNLKNIFTSQNPYAKLVAREIVYEINSQKGQFYSLFKEDIRDELAGIWQNTLAAREAIASGIYVVAKDNTLLHSFSYQIPYIDIHKKDIFPFWHVEAVDADLFGKKVSLAVATINVFEKGSYLGYIMVQVLNSAESVLRSLDQKSVFNLDRKINAAGMGYIKVDGSGGIRENPANINLENLAALLAEADSWISFRTMGVDYRGYVFRSNDETVVVFYPKRTFFKTFSEFTKILIALMLLAAIFNFRRLREFQWRFLFQSFSLKVFAILVLLTIITAVVFSIFSLNFNSLALETQQQRAIYSRGRSALNIINNLLAESGEITQNHLFLLGKILENDISVYENGVLLHTSNHRKIIQSQLSIYLNSGIRDVLQQGNQQFYLQKMENSLALFFKAGDAYIFDIEFAYNRANLAESRRTYVDFLITVFFILIVCGMAAAFFFRNKIMAPIHLLNRGMADVQQGRLQPLGDVPAETELRELVHGFNAMLEGIKEQKKNVSEIARMKTLVELGRRVAHEVKNPLTPIKLSAEQILRSLQDPDNDPRPVITSAVRYIIEETEHLRRVAFGFLNLSKLDELKPGPFSLTDLIAEAVSQLRSIYPHVRFMVEESSAAIEVVADRQKIKQVLDNVLTNAVEAVAGRDGKIEVSLAQQGKNAEVRIRDNGTGISNEELQRIASEEFSSKDLGTGLGLVIARRFLELHQGGLDIQSTPDQGTLVIMRFAKHAPQA
ncbi:MAG: HAMP domain-containing sensor histidine kinase [Candidatus Aminicenantes bacterium]|nr:HAMP domain-containing sensor histidine kinase [Candidatus Aminicenantes bacterium]